jgi:hypothetical protein
MSEPIDPQKALRTIAAQAPLHAQAKANRVYMEEYRKTLKARLMQKAESAGHKTAAVQEREAYADAEYVLHLRGLQAAVEAEETSRWTLIACQAAVEVWRSQESSNRMMDRGTR